MRNSEKINRSFTEFYCDYSKNMKVAPAVSLQSYSSYSSNPMYSCTIEDWVWFKRDESSDVEFSFDSSAEKAWAEKLRVLARKKNNEKNTIAYSAEDADEEDVYFWGKNFVENSEIKYQYFLHGIHVSYPDFIMKDSFDRIHLFEVKSVNNSSFLNINQALYNEKVRALKECYKFASKLTGHDFWLPIQTGNDWVIYHYKDFVEEEMSFEQFKEYLKSKP